MGEVRSSVPMAIFGGGLTGLAAALHAKRDFELFEAAASFGGKARSRRRDGHTFDVTGHWLHLRDDRVKTLIRDLFVDEDWVEVERITGVFTQGAMLPYPFQANLHGLPPATVERCLVDFVQAALDRAAGSTPRATTFRDFAAQRFGAGMAEAFFVPYNRKLWGAAFDELTADWVSRFIPIPDPAQVIAGALGRPQHGLGYNARFRYPKRGGIDLLAEGLARAAAARAQGGLHTGSALAGLDPSARRASMVDGTLVEYETAISTLPLPHLIGLIDGVPQEVRAAAESLRAVSWRYLDVATKSPVPMREHWVYVPDPGVPFFRVGVYSNALPAMAPENCGSLYVELSDRSGPLDFAAVARALADMGAIESPDDVKFFDEHRIENAYVVFDDRYAESRRTCLEYLEAHDIHSAGRYGSWVYNSMEDSIIAGMELAERLG